MSSWDSCLVASRSGDLASSDVAEKLEDKVLARLVE
jgi:hypothetical protein